MGVIAHSYFPPTLTPHWIPIQTSHHKKAYHPLPPSIPISGEHDDFTIPACGILRSRRCHTDIPIGHQSTSILFLHAHPSYPLNDSHQSILNSFTLYIVIAFFFINLPPSISTELDFPSSANSPHIRPQVRYQVNPHFLCCEDWMKKDHKTR